MEKERIPPGQTLTKNFPALHIGGIPAFKPEKWDFKVFGSVRKPITLNWTEFNKLPVREQTSDFHCVTGWTRLDCRWSGVPFSSIASLAMPEEEAKYILVHAEHGYTTNLPLAELMEDDVLFVLKLDDKPLPPIHGGPVRLVVPKRYAYKSAKWVRGIEFLKEDKRGYWETRGYSNTADPWLEERYA